MCIRDRSEIVRYLPRGNLAFKDDNSILTQCRVDREMRSIDILSNDPF